LASLPNGGKRAGKCSYDPEARREALKLALAKNASVREIREKYE
jgi:hypothetical protein